jgi:hypothetical protein
MFFLDDTQVDQPDTPGPVFAARALKRAIFGTPAGPIDAVDSQRDQMIDSEQASQEDSESKTPHKPAGILLTPGTGTSRRKRVSFGRDVLDKGGNPLNGKGNSAESQGKGLDGVPSGKGFKRRTKLMEALENSRRINSAASSGGEKQNAPPATEVDSEDDWEEDGEDFCSHDITVDLNEPHSQSGKYWKLEFEQYHQDAKAEMEKLLKYKQLAKSFAKMKDAEAIDMQQKLREEQEKVVAMEKKISEMAASIASKRLRGEDTGSQQLMKDLAKQTALAVQYRSQVNELELLMGGNTENPESKFKRRRQIASPRTQKTLLETQRELRRARTQLKEIGELRDQVVSLKSKLAAAEQCSDKPGDGRKKIGDNTQKDSAGIDSDLKLQLKAAKEESRQKDDEIRRIRKEYNSFRIDAMAQQKDAKQVLERATDKISELKKEIKSLKSLGNNEVAPRPKSLPTLATNQSRPPDRKRDNASRSSIDRHDPIEPNSSRNTKDSVEPQSLRQKFHEDALQPSTDRSNAAQQATNIVADRVSLEKPRWQPYIPRSPRNRAYLDGDIAARIGSLTTSYTEPKTNSLELLTSQVANGSRSRVSKAPLGEIAQPRIDLLQDKFAPLGAAHVDSSALMSANTSKCTLSPGRRAAAIARIEQRKADKKKSNLSVVHNKENLRP